MHEGHLVELTDRDRRHIVPELAGAFFVGDAATLQQKVDAFAEQGAGELVYWPMGSDIDGELRRMAEALGA